METQFLEHNPEPHWQKQHQGSVTLCPPHPPRVCPFGVRPQREKKGLTKPSWVGPKCMWPYLQLEGKGRRGHSEIQPVPSASLGLRIRGAFSKEAENTDVPVSFSSHQSQLPLPRPEPSSLRNKTTHWVAIYLQLKISILARGS